MPKGVHRNASRNTASSVPITHSPARPLRVRGEPPLESVWRHSHCVKIDVYKDGRHSDVRQRVTRSNECDGLRDDFFVTHGPSKLQCNMQCSGAIHRSDRIFRPYKFRDHALKFCDLRTHRRDEIGIDTFRKIAALVSLKHRTVQRDLVGTIDFTDDFHDRTRLDFR